MSVTLQATVITGFEPVARKEVESLFGCKCTQKRGYVRFPVKVEDIRKALSLRSVDNLYAVLYDYEIDGLRQMNAEDGLNILKAQLPLVNWADAIEYWQVAHEKEIKGGSQLIKDQMREFMTDGSFHPVTTDSTKYRVTCNRAGDKSVHSFSSMDAARVFGAQLNNVFGWKPDMKNYDIEIVLNIRDDSVLILISLNAETMFKRNVCAYGPTTMRSTMCYCMVALARPAPGVLIVDPMCGGGSIPLEGALAFPDSIFMGGDNHPKAIERCHENMKNNESSLKQGSLSFSAWDACQLPFVDGAVTHIVTDLPFGKKIGSVGDNRVLYPKLLKEWHRVTGAGSRLVVMSHDKRSLENSLSSMRDLWSTDSSYMVNVGGLSALCLVLKNLKEK